MGRTGVVVVGAGIIGAAAGRTASRPTAVIRHGEPAALYVAALDRKDPS
jgi:glycine/D-amino acid oxidase-like deaminating enzyme